jgi:predicted amidohydrolase YtcJ
MRVSRPLLAVAALVWLGACSSSKPIPDREAPPGVAGPLPKLYVGPTFLTGDEAMPEARAILVDDDGRISRVHVTDPGSSQDYERVELPGALAVPGLHDAHAHLLGIGQQKDRVDLLGSASPADVVAKVKAFAAAHPDAAVVKGRGWDQSLFEGKQFPTAADLAGAADKPVFLSRVDGHAVWVNDKVLAAAKITKDTKDPEGGRILRDAKGAPTGIFVDNAIDLVSKVLPAPSASDLERWLEAGAKAAADAGLVAIHDMGFSVDALPALEKLAAEGRLPIRVYAYLDGSDGRALEAATGFVSNDHVDVRGLKLFADGAMGSRGAALIEDYSDEAGHKGLLLTDPKVLSEKVRAIHAAGKQVAIHAIGDRGNRVALEAIDVAQGRDTSRRHRVEHAQLIHPDDFEGFVATGAIASMQPTHATSDMRWAKDRVGEARLPGAYAWRTMLVRKIPLAFGSDAPVESHKPAWGLYAAVTRQDHAGAPDGGWRPDQRLGIHEALGAFSSGAAYAVGRESEQGVLKQGYIFDVSVFDVDARNDPKAWLKAEATATVLGGKLRRADEGDA